MATQSALIHTPTPKAFTKVEYPQVYLHSRAVVELEHQLAELKAKPVTDNQVKRWGEIAELEAKVNNLKHHPKATNCKVILKVPNEPAPLEEAMWLKGTEAVSLKVKLRDGTETTMSLQQAIDLDYVSILNRAEETPSGTNGELWLKTHSVPSTGIEYPQKVAQTVHESLFIPSWKP